MTDVFQCDGCGEVYSSQQKRGTLDKHDDKGDFTFEDIQDLCDECYKATREFLKNRLDSKTGVNTGYSSNSTFYYSGPISGTTTTRDIVTVTTAPEKKKPKKRRTKNKV